MTTTLLKVFDDFEAADVARHELIAAGRLSAAVQLRVLEDEAGPVEGNFLVGNGRPAVRGVSRPLRAPQNHPPDYALNFAKVVSRGAYLLVVEVADGESAERCTEFFRRFDTAP